MTDRELLELAAKAAGYELLPNTDGWFPDGPYRKVADSNVRWNPLDLNGDAFRLAVQLDLEVYQGVNNDLLCAHAGYAAKDRRIYYCIEVHEGTGKEAATRRAIVRAAAELGKSK